MTKTQKTPQDYFKSMTDIFEALPKTPEDTKVVFAKMQSVLNAEIQNGKDMMNIYKKAVTGDATANEITTANKKAAELMKATTFASLLAIPGSLFFLPTILEKAKEYDVDLVPASVSAVFNI